VRADVVEAAHPAVFAAHDDQRRAGRVVECAEVERLCQFRLVAGDQPAFAEDARLLLTKQIGV
jgi:hypothetical protein